MNRVAPLGELSPAHPQSEGAFQQNEGMQGASMNATTAATTTLYLLTVQGTIIGSREQARVTHNQTAGNPESVAAARALSDVSHIVYVPVNGHEDQLFFMDQWTDLAGLAQFFSNPQVEHSAGMLFSSREPTVWAPADGFSTYHMPTPSGRNERYIGLVRGEVHSADQAREVYNRLAAETLGRARTAGHLSHEMYFKAIAPGEPASLELLGVDVWNDLEQMGKFYGDPTFLRRFDGLYAVPAATWVLRHPEEEWVEW
jgi:hypothetical protein